MSIVMRPMKKRCRVLPAGVWGCPPDIKVPQEWGSKGVDCDCYSQLYEITLLQDEYITRTNITFTSRYIYDRISNGFPVV